MKKNLFKLSFLLILVWFFWGTGQAKADTATTTLDISVSNSSPYDGATTTISVLQFDQGVDDWLPAANATINFGWGATTTNINGQADITATSSIPFSVSASKTNFLSSNSINITPQAAQARITIRAGATVAFAGAAALPASNAAAVNISPTGATSTVAVPARSLLAILKTLDVAQNEFAITDLQYYSYFTPPSFYIKCMTVASEASPLCNLWQYNLNGVYPWDAVDQAKLKNGDIVILYFGNQRQVSLSTTATTIGASFTATAQKYDLASGSYVAVTGVTIGVTQPNPDDLWNPLEIATSTVDANGRAIFTLNTAGTYNIGIKEDYYSPLTTLTITAPAPASSGGSVIIPAAGGGNSSPPAATDKVDLGKAINFLISKQNADGSFGSALITDWAAIALASANPNGSAGQKAKSYLLTDPNPLVGLNPVSDYARRAMALMSLNISPYGGTKTDYIKKIVGLFDGRQFGDAALYNDDIFALLVLNKAGYGADDEMIKKAVDFIISRQQADGSWNGVDLTAAAIQALKPVSALNGVSAVLTKAKSFLAGAQKADGGFGDTYATSWAIQAITALGENSGNWQKNNKTPESYLVLSQGVDGGLEKDNSYEINRIWSTAYAIPAVSNKAWFNILSSFAKENTAIIKNEPAGNLLSGHDLIATSTPEKSDLATSSPAIAPQTLDQASTTAVFLTAEADNNKNKDIIKPAKSDIKTMINLPVNPKKPLPPPVLRPKIEPPKTLNINNQANQTEKIVQTAPARADSLTPEVKGAEEKPAEPNKINNKAKKVLYMAGAGTILAGIVLILKFLGFLL